MAWLVPTVVYVCIIGALGVTTKLALRTAGWQELFVWSAVSYVAVAAVLVGSGAAQVRLREGSGWILLTALMVALSLIAFYVALGQGEASKVVPVTAAYPVVTLVLAAAFLSEPVSAVRLAGVGLVVSGVVIVTAGS
jgi:transporter family protein